MGNQFTLAMQEPIIDVVFDDRAEEIFQSFADEWYGDWISAKEDGKNKALTIVPFYHTYTPRVYISEPSTALYIPFKHEGWDILLLPYKEYSNAKYR